MKKGKIVKLTINEWDWQYWKMYSHKMELDNWETIKLNKKKDNSFKVGDTVSYEDNGEWKWKEVKEENNFKPKSYDNQSNNVWAMIWMSIKLAFEQLYDKKNYDETMNLAKRIFWDAMQMFESYNKPENKSDENEDQNLPF